MKSLSNSSLISSFCASIVALDLPEEKESVVVFSAIASSTIVWSSACVGKRMKTSVAFLTSDENGVVSAVFIMICLCVEGS